MAVSGGWVKRGILMSVAMVAVSAPAANRPEPARTHPLLFNYFRQQLLGLHVQEDAYGRRYLEVDVQSLDRQAYALTCDFFYRVDKKLDALKQGFEEVQLARSEALRGPMEFRPKARAMWSGSLKHVADEAGDLHGMLNIMLSEVGPKGPPMPNIDMQGLDSGFENETRLMGDQILRLDQRIRDFLAGEVFTVSVQELRGDDMLMLLSRVRTEAGEMRKGLDAAVPPGARLAAAQGLTPD